MNQKVLHGLVFLGRGGRLFCFVFACFFCQGYPFVKIWEIFAIVTKEDMFEIWLGLRNYVSESVELKMGNILTVKPQAASIPKLQN